MIFLRNPIYRLILLAVICALASCLSCTPEKRLARLVKKHSELIRKDTVKIVDSILTSLIRSDTVVNWASLTDTIILTKDSLTVTVYRIRDSVYIGGTVKPYTIYKTIKVPVDRIVNPVSTPKKSPWTYVLIGAFSSLFLIVLFLLYIRPKNPY